MCMYDSVCMRERERQTHRETEGDRGHIERQTCNGSRAIGLDCRKEGDNSDPPCEREGFC